MLEDLRIKWAHANSEDRKKIEAAAENIKQELIMYKSYDALYSGSPSEQDQQLVVV